MRSFSLGKLELGFVGSIQISDSQYLEGGKLKKGQGKQDDSLTEGVRDLDKLTLVKLRYSGLEA